MQKIAVFLLLTAFVHPPRKWAILFDGTSTEHWRGYKKDYLPAEWTIENGTLTLTKKGGGYIVTKEEYENFELQLDWKISEAGNSGVFFHVSEDTMYKVPYESGPECQILDDERHPDAVKGKEGTHKAGANYDLQAPLVNAVKPAGEWNSFVLKVKNGHVQHWLNGKQFITKTIRNQTRVVVRVDPLSQGMYVVVLRRKNGQAVYLKFIKGRGK